MRYFRIVVGLGISTYTSTCVFMYEAFICNMWNISLIDVYTCINASLYFSEHQELAQQLATRPTLKDYRQQEKKLQILADQMDSKSKQIDIVLKELQSREVCPRKRMIKQNSTCQKALSPREASVKFLRNMKAVRTTLQQDNLSWD